MKEALLLLFFIFSLSEVCSQTWAPVGAKWYYGASANGAAPTGSEYYLYHAEKDTLFAGHSCKKISRTYFQYTGNVSTLMPLFTYQSGDTVFYYNEIIEKYAVLYQFDVEQGDTLLLYSPDEYLFSMDSTFRLVVDSVSFMLVPPDTLKMVYTRPLDHGSFWHPYIEKIGCTFLMLPQSSIIFPEWDGPMRCYTESEIYFTQGIFPCDHWITNPVFNVTPGDVEVFPVPTGEQLIVRTIVPAGFSILSVTGKLLMTGKTEDDETILDVSSLPGGTYFLMLHYQEELRVKKFTR